MDETTFKGLYRIPSARWAGWDYASNAAYFITICTHQRMLSFGAIRNAEMSHTPLGLAAVGCWYAIPDHFPFVMLDAFVVMPNHMHGILIIDRPASPPVVETQNLASLQSRGNNFGPQSKNLASIVRGYKIGVTKYATQHNIPFKWQPRYYDRVIRDHGEYERIRHYIDGNVANWQQDSLFDDNV